MGTGSELSWFCESRSRSQLGACPQFVRCPFLKSALCPAADTGTGTATQGYYPTKKRYRAEPVPVSTPFMKLPGSLIPSYCC